MRTNNTQKLTVYALFLAIMLVMGLVPGLGFIPTPFAALVIIQVPVILASYFLGYKGGIIFGAVFGITSIINCFIQPDAFAAIILSSKGIMPLILMVVCHAGAYFNCQHNSLFIKAAEAISPAA